MSEETNISASGEDTPQTFTSEQVQAMIAEQTAGLKSKVDELLGEKKTVAQKAREAEAAKLALEQEAAKNSGKLDEFEKSLRGEFDKERSTLQEQLSALNSRVVGESKRAVLGSITGEFITGESIDLISPLVKTSLDGDTVKTEFTDFAGNVITTDKKEFVKWMGNHPAISHLMKADTSTGGGATGQHGKSGGASFNGKKYSEMTLKEQIAYNKSK